MCESLLWILTLDIERCNVKIVLGDRDLLFKDKNNKILNISETVIASAKMCGSIL